MLKILQILFSITAAVLAGYGLFTKDSQFQGYMILFLGLSMLLAGLQEFKHNKKITFMMLVGIFLTFIAIRFFILNY